MTIHVNGAEYVLKGGQKISVSLKHRASRRPEKALARLRRQSVSGDNDNDSSSVRRRIKYSP